MSIYTTKSVYTITVVLSIIIFLILNLVIDLNIGKFSKPKIISNNLNKQTENESIINSEIESQVNKNIINQQYNWYIEIKSIGLKAPIEETVSNDILSRSVGHFEESSLENGNIGLAAHNRGYEINYFENLKFVKINDEIEYHYKNFSKKYLIDKIEIIQDTDWSYLEKSKKNKITLITCVENEPKLRRCVQATEKE